MACRPEDSKRSWQQNPVPVHMYDKCTAKPLLPQVQTIRGNPTIKNERDSKTILFGDIYSNPDAYNGLPQTYLVMSIVVCIFFNCPLGCLGIVYSMLSVSSFREGDIEGAKRRARCAMILSFSGVVVTVMVIIGLIVYYIKTLESEHIDQHTHV